MKLIQEQEQRQTQQQKLTQQQMMLVRLLEMPLTELEQNVQAELDDNPALETDAYGDDNHPADTDEWGDSTGGEGDDDNFETHEYLRTVKTSGAEFDNEVAKFQQQFVKQQFNVKASDMARKIAMAPSLAKTGVNPSDRAAVRKFAEKENVNFIARGEVAVLRYARVKGGKIKASLQIGVEVIDVNSGEVIAAFSNAVHTVATSAEVARNGGINKAAVVAARTLSEQVLDAWINAADNGAQFTVELRNMKSARSQKIPFEKALKSVVTINSQTQPKKDIVTYAVTFKGSKSDLGMAILEAVGDKPGFDEKSFEGPNDIDGKVVFEFLK